MIRRAGLGDIPWIIEAAARAKDEAPHYARYTARVGEQYKRFVSLMQLPDLAFIGVCEDQTGCVIGSLEPTVWFEEFLGVVNILWVAPEKRGTSRAWRLMAAFEDWALERGAARLLAGVSSGLNEHLTGRFYEKMGYTPAGMTYTKELT